MNASKLSPKVALLNFDATLGSAYSDVVKAITSFSNQAQLMRSNSVEIKGKSYLISKAIDTKLIPFGDVKLNEFLGQHVPKFLDKSNIWFVYNQTDACILYFADTLSRVDNALFDVMVSRPDVAYQPNGMFSAEYMELISNLDSKSYQVKYNSQELPWQQPNVQSTIQVAPNVVVPSAPEVSPTSDVDVSKVIAEVLKALGQ